MSSNNATNCQLLLFKIAIVACATFRHALTVNGKKKWKEDACDLLTSRRRDSAPRAAPASSSAHLPPASCGVITARFLLAQCIAGSSGASKGRSLDSGE